MGSEGGPGSADMGLTPATAHSRTSKCCIPQQVQCRSLEAVLLLFLAKGVTRGGQRTWKLFAASVQIRP